MMNTTVNAQYNKQGIAPVKFPVGGFAIDGDAYANKSPVGTDYDAIGDWFENSGTSGWLINADNSYTIPEGDGTLFKLYVDVFKDKDPTAFPGNNKINDNPNTYTVGLANVPKKDDMERAAVYFSYADETLLGGAEGDLWCVFAADRWVVGGASYIDFEFNQASTVVNEDGTVTSLAPEFDGDGDPGDPTGGRTPGDILITIEFTRGGTTASLYADKWDKPAIGQDYTWMPLNIAVDFPNSIYCTENTVETLAPWPVYDQGNNLYAINQFAEGAI
ncbi:hypothetical protein KAH27_09915, partial [bacterium]|nr:hypothetical protein [bacterium]